MSLWSAMQSVAASIIGLIGTGVGYVWDEEMGRIDQPQQNGTTTEGANTAQNVEEGGVEGEHAQQENASIANVVSDVAVGESAGSVEQPTATGNGENDATDNRLRLRAWGRGCGGCGISMPATDARRKAGSAHFGRYPDRPRMHRPWNYGGSESPSDRQHVQLHGVDVRSSRDDELQNTVTRSEFGEGDKVMEKSYGDVSVLKGRRGTVAAGRTSQRTGFK
ncbi:hypothetical protein K488DRAFT_72434 [Vararia minispora EC-137]|uniref:Uncharacterized protein n=1 Tax=Vararia minispora EC-137 TaxID=1314806 RepID=A0ACB8QEU9_9AGAM|nr:hypothetical protein K488DRAFT_72434 [Vararia minispora EC-137]